MAETKMQLADWLDDLCVRFIINLPEEELESAERICFQVEEAQWFYEDFVRPLDPTLPSLNLRQFCLLMFQRCPLLAPFPEHQHVAAFDEFLAYKVRVPVRGAIMLDQNMEEVVLVKGWKKSANWSFPRGKINKDEDDLDCAIREVYEETGFDIRAAGLVHDRQKQKHIDVTMREQHMKLFVFRGVSKDTVFIPRTRKEISKIQWYRLADLPGYHKNKPNKHGDLSETVSSSKLYMVAPFMQPLKKWIALQRKAETQHLPQMIQDEVAAECLLTDQGEVADDGELESTNPMPVQYILTKSQTDELVPHLLNTHDQQANAETASQLKKLLNVGPANHDPLSLSSAAPSYATANKLLAILRHGTKSSPPGAAPHLPGLPRTPIGQISVDSPMPSSPHHHQSHQPSMSNMPPPPLFSIPLPHTVTPQTHDAHVTLPNVINSQNYHHNHYPTVPVSESIPDQGLTTNHTGRNLTENDHLHYSNQHYSQHSKQPYQPTADVHYDTSKQTSLFQIPNTSQVAEQPARNLSTHAQNLLDTLKARKTLTSIVPNSGSQSDILPPSLFGLLSATTGNNPPGPTQLATNMGPLAHSQSRSRQAFASATDKPVTTNIPLVSRSGPSVVSPIISKANSQRDNLLSLFRSPPTTKTMMDITKTASHGLQPAAFELSAIPSPRPQDRPIPSPSSAPISGNSASLTTIDIPLEQRAELSAIPSPSLLPQVMKRHTATKLEENVSIPPYVFSKRVDEVAPRISDVPPHTSATLPGPPNVPDISTVKRKLHAPKSPSLAVTNVFDALTHEESGTSMQPSRGIKTAYGRLEKSNQHQTHHPTPIQILKRPTTHAPALPNPDKTVTSTVGAPTLKKSPPTPTIPVSPARIKARSPKPPTPKPFQPQILRRPQPSSSVEPPADLPATTQSTLTPVSAVTTTSPETAAASATNVDRKQALLSLFSPPKITAAPIGFPSPVEDKPPVAESTNLPVTELPKIKVPTLQLQSSSTDQTKALLSLFSNNSSNFKSNNKPILPSLSSRPENLMTATLNKLPPPPSTNPLGIKVINARAPVPSEVARSRLNSMTSVPGSGTQTPISPSDRGFLVSYLRGL